MDGNGGSDYRTIRLFVVALVVFAILLGGGLWVMGYLGYANVLKESFSGYGTVDIEHYTGNTMDRASIENANLTYEAHRVWGVDDDKEEFVGYVEISGARGGSKFKNRYEVRSRGAGYAHYYGAFNISGEFSGSAEITVITGSENNPASINSLFLMDSKRGNATFTGRVYKYQNGKPATESETELVGKFALESYLNVTESPKTPDDWLGFCAEVNAGLPDGLMILPAGTTLEEGKIALDKAKKGAG